MSGGDPSQSGGRYGDNEQQNPRHRIVIGLLPRGREDRGT